MKSCPETSCSSLLKIIKSGKLNDYLFEGNFGIERENIRVDSKGVIAETKHPEVFGEKLSNPYITVDFAESQIELITPTFDSILEVHDFLENLHDIVSLELKEEYLWPQSTPPDITDEGHISVADFDAGDAGKHAAGYRRHLVDTYGKVKQVLSGIHFNFSFSDNFLKKLYSEINKQSSISFKDFKNDIYMRVARNYTRFRWIIIYLLGASPSVHKTYTDGDRDKLKKINDAYYLEEGVSFRQSDFGYKNTEDFFVPLDSLECYLKTIDDLIADGSISGAREYYSPIRLKAKDNTNLLESLRKDGIEYLEIRTIDLNPYSNTGIDIRDIYFLHAFMIFCLLRKCKSGEDCLFSKTDNSDANFNQELIATKGQDKNLSMKDKSSVKDAKEWGIEILNELQEILCILSCNNKKYSEAIDFELEKFLDGSKSYSKMLIEDIKKHSFIGFHLSKAKEYLVRCRNSNFLLRGYEDLELSTQILIKAAIKRGISFKILDRTDNFIRLTNSKKSEIVKQATKTSEDTFICAEIMENKIVTKNLLNENEISTPLGLSYTNKNKALESYSEFRNKLIVIKPKSENFGIGITIFKSPFSLSEFETAVNLAFQNGGPIIIEEFIAGEEFRFFIIDNELLGVLQRVPANVIGDGIHTIEELVEIKNQDSLRGEGYKTPLEKIKLGVSEKMFLGHYGKKISDIPAVEEVVFLRENSNISTGGDSIDYTDDIPQAYKDIAVKAARAVYAKICGIDMIINDISNDKPTNRDYAVIEANFNPAIHIHTYPYKGKQREIAEKILDLLGF
jgi:glutamate--cysteine ligase